MNKQEMIDELSQYCGLTHMESQELFDATVKVLQETIIDDKAFTVPGFGTFENRERKSHRYFDLVRKKLMIAPSKLAITFHANSAMKNRLYTLRGYDER